ncbi:MAG: hypothetical protein WBO70_00180 [Erysipelotrichaceae bacterium]
MNVKRLEKMCRCFGVSSSEIFVREILINSFNSLCDEIKTDKLGSCFGVKKSKNKNNAKTLMIASSLDEVGFIISEINSDGTLSFITLENVDLSSLLYQRVNILTRCDKLVTGVIMSKVSILENFNTNLKINDLYIDINKGEEDVRKIITIGDLVGYCPNFYLEDNNIYSKALFPRVLNEVIISVLEKIKDKEYDFDIAIGGVAQSVIGFRGSQTITNVIKPDIAIALTGFDANVLKHEFTNSGVLSYYDRQMLPNKLMVEEALNITKFKPCISSLGNDGSFIHKTLDGCPTISLGLKINNMGSSNEIINSTDVEKLSNGIIDYIDFLSNEKIEKYCGK